MRISVGGEEKLLKSPFPADVRSLTSASGDGFSFNLWKTYRSVSLLAASILVLSSLIEVALIAVVATAIASVSIIPLVLRVSVVVVVPRSIAIVIIVISEGEDERRL